MRRGCFVGGDVPRSGITQNDEGTKVRSQSIYLRQAPIQFNILFSVMIVPVMMPLWQMKLSLQALRREMSLAAS